MEALVLKLDASADSKPPEDPADGRKGSSVKVHPIFCRRHEENSQISLWRSSSLCSQLFLQFTSHPMSTWRSTRTSWLFRDTRSCWAIRPKSATSTSAWRRRVWKTGDTTCCLTSSSGVCFSLLVFFLFLFNPLPSVCFGWTTCFFALSWRRFTPEFFQGCSVDETQLHSLQLHPLFTSQYHTLEEL